MGLWVRVIRGWPWPVWSSVGCLSVCMPRPWRRRATPWRRPHRRSSSRATGASRATRSAPISALAPGERLDAAKVDEGVKALFATGLFADVRPTWSGRPRDRHGGRELGDQPHPVRGQQARQGRAASAGNPVEAARRAVAADGAVRRAAHRRDLPPQRPLRRPRRRRKIIDRPNNRVDLVFEINEGGKTTVKDIDFVGNRAYSTWRLRDVIKTGAERTS